MKKFNKRVEFSLLYSNYYAILHDVEKCSNLEYDNTGVLSNAVHAKTYLNINQVIIKAIIVAYMHLFLEGISNR